MQFKFHISLFIPLLLLAACRTEPETISAEETDSAPGDTVRVWTPDDNRHLTGYFAERGLLRNGEGVSPGYILFNPASAVSTFLMNKKGEIVHQWESDLNSMQAYLKPNGNLVRLDRDPDFPVFAAGGQAGRIREYDWEGNMIWDFEYATEKYLNHHDIAILPNGNILAISFDAKTPEEAIAAGRDPEHIPPGGIWSDKIIEIKPTYPEGGEIVWEWRMWDHLVQDKFPDKDNYGVVADHPRRININVFDENHPPPPPPEQIEGMKAAGFITSNATADNWDSDIFHTNAITYNADLDQIAISVPGYGEIFLIDHSTTTEEAAGNEGGLQGTGGDLLYRWGNPQNYGRGGEGDRVLYFQHDIRWIEKGLDGEGQLMVFNNDIPRMPDNSVSIFGIIGQAQQPDPPIPVSQNGNYSAVHTFSPERDDTGNYLLPEDGPFQPLRPGWVYTAPDTLSFYSPFVSGAERMPGGNTLILSGAQGRMFEINPEGKIVWEYWQPYFFDYKLPDGSMAQPGGPFIFGQYRIKQYAPDFPGFAGKDLTPLAEQPEVHETGPAPSK